MTMIRCSKFAALCGTTRDTLLHYDAINLLKPAWVDPQTKYRYYSATQFNRFSSIKALTDAGLSLEATRDLLDHCDLEALIAALDEGTASIERTIADLQDSATCLKVMRAQAKRGLMFPPGCPRVEHLDKRIVMPVKGYPKGTILSYVEDDELNQIYIQAFHTLRELSPTAWLAPYGLTSQGPVGGPVEYDSLFFLLEDARDIDKIEDTRSFPAGDYACIGYEGPWDDVSLAHKALMAYVESIGGDPSGERIEISTFRLFDTDSANGMNAYRCVVSMLLA